MATTTPTKSKRAATENAATPLSNEELLRLYKQMVEIRLFEEKCEELYQKGKIGGFMHLYIGQEATGVGTIAARRPDDNIITGYRDHGAALACGMSARVAMAEMMGRVDGCSKGKGGSMHLADINLKFWGGHAIVGAQIALGTGLAWAEQYKKTGAVTLAYFGDGASNIGYFHESLNLAKVWNLPIVYICENNKYGMWTPVEKVSATTSMAHKAVSYDIPSDIADGMDLLDVYAKTQKAIEHCRNGNGPYFLEIVTYRYRGHSMGDQRAYRTAEEIKKWQADDPIGKFEDVLLKAGIDPTAIDAVDDEVKAMIEDAVAFADASPFPALDEIYTDITIE
ncbi:MAG: pyruvate dehydrogenase (acetyl-transferring) E1 component subunit alpha [Anaerolineales bacterium]|nr:pyruvate dehydrogenase (acetyl-transferring) E1 component subunit alpha [Anaerolineales bacterium]